MDKHLFGEQVIEVSGNGNTSYLLKNSEMFYDVGYRVMKNQTTSILQCHKLKYNGLFKFVFFTEEYTSLETMIRTVEADRIVLLISNLIRAIEDIQSNGFLNMACIDERLDHIFIDNRTMEARLVYLPINIPMQGNGKNEFESNIRSQLIKIIQEMQSFGSGKLSELVSVLMDGNILSLVDVGRRLHITPVVPTTTPRREEPKVMPVSIPENNPMVSTSNGLALTSLNGKATIIVTKEHFVIGKSPDKADGVIEGNSAVSRVHCEVTKQNGKWYIMDKNSANGTSVNGQKINPGQLIELCPNDNIRIANEEYIVRG